MNAPRPHPCGTYGGYQRHKKAGEASCAACLDANSAYHRDYRNRTDQTEAHVVTAARGRAQAQLAAAHRAEFEALFLTEIRKGRGAA